MIKSAAKGKKYEVYLRKKYREHGFSECETSRYASKKEDDSGVDLVGTGSLVVQAKSYAKFSTSQTIAAIKYIPEKHRAGKITACHIKITKVGSVVALTEEDRFKIVPTLIEKGII